MVCRLPSFARRIALLNYQVRLLVTGTIAGSVSCTDNIIHGIYSVICVVCVPAVAYSMLSISDSY